MRLPMTEALEAIADRFHPREQITAIRSLGSGNVNETFLVTYEGASEKGHFVMQRLFTSYCKLNAKKQKPFTPMPKIIQTRKNEIRAMLTMVHY